MNAAPFACVALVAASVAFADPIDPVEVTVTITDSPANSTLAGFFDELTQDGEIPEEGYRKTYALEGHPVREEFRPDTRSGVVTALVGGRVTVDVESEGLEPEQMRAWLRRIDLRRLGEMRAKAPGATISVSELESFLPPPPQGWTAEPAQGSTKEAGGFPTNEASRAYRK